jgi:hypothetical protein
MSNAKGLATALYAAIGLWALKEGLTSFLDAARSVSDTEPGRVCFSQVAGTISVDSLLLVPPALSLSWR